MHTAGTRPCFSSGLNMGVRNLWEQGSPPVPPHYGPSGVGGPRGGEMCAPSHSIALANKGLCPLQWVLLGMEGWCGVWGRL